MCNKIKNFKIANFLGFDYSSLDNPIFHSSYEHHQYNKSITHMLPVLEKIKTLSGNKWNTSPKYAELRKALVELDEKRLFKAINNYLNKENHD
jgi:hypothetical protein